MSVQCANCRRLEAELERTRGELNRLAGELQTALERIAELEKELRRGRRQAAPFSRDKSKSEKKRPGRRPGQGKFRRLEPPSQDQIQRTEEVELKCCPDCGNWLQDFKRHEQFQLDIPPIRPEWVQFVTHSGYCPSCRARKRSRHPEQASVADGPARTSYGPRIKTFGIELKHRLGVPYRKIQEFFEGALGFSPTPGAMVQSEQALARKLEPVYEELCQALRQAASVHGDETGWRVGVLSAWLWVFTNQHVTVYLIDEKRSHEVILEVLGRQFRGVLVSDYFLAYDAAALDDWLKQKCYAQLIRDFAKLEKEKKRGAVRFPRAVLCLLREALVLRERREELEPKSFEEQVWELEKRLDSLIDEGRRFSDPDNGRLAKRLRKQRDYLFMFLHLEGVDATNNRAERALRPAVVVRKTGGANRTWSGARAHSVLASVLVSLRQQGRRALSYIPKVLTAPGAPPSLVEPEVLDSS